MKREHPKELFLLIDRASDDKEYEAVRKHVESCPECREEVRAAQGFEGMFRTGNFEIEVPPFQWERIRARLETYRPATGWRDRICEALIPRRAAFKYALGILLTVVVGLSGFEYYRYNERTRLAAFMSYYEAQRPRIESADNPFRAYLTAQNQNPFAKVQIPEDRMNPFAVL